MNNTISLDVALVVLDNIEAICLNEMRTATGDRLVGLEKEQKMYSFERKVLYGTEGNEDMRQSLCDKINRLYSPLVKSYNESPRN